MFIKFLKKSCLLLVASSTVFALDVNDLSALSSLQQGNNTNQQATSSSNSSANPATIVPPIVSSAKVDSYSNSSASVISNVSDSDVSDNVNNSSIATKPRPPVLPNDFQRSVAIRTGLNLQQFGYDQFRIPTTYNLVNNIPLSTSYVIAPGDQIYIQTWGSVSINYKVDVSSEGTIFIPNIGRFNVAGIKSGSLESYLQKKIGGVYKKFQLSATVSKIRSIQINVAGYAQSPGSYTVSSLTNLSDAIAAVGGPANNGSLRDIQLKRDGVVIDDFDMYKILLQGNNAKDIRLLSGDIIYFKPKLNEIAIYDGVKFPYIFEMLPNETVADALRFAGGATFDNTKSKVIVEQIKNDSFVVHDYSYNEGLSQRVSDGAIIHFMKMNKKYDDSVVLMGNVANPTRLHYRQGMTVHDVIPSKDALLTSSFWNSYSYNSYGKDNILTMLGNEKTINTKSNDMPSYTLSAGVDSSATNNQKDLFSNADNLLIAGPVNIPQADINWRYATIIRIDPNNFTSHIIPFDLESAIAGDPSQNITLMPGDIIDILSSKDVRNPVSYHPVFVFLDGEVKRPGVYELRQGETLIDAVNKAGGLTNNSYLFGLVLQRKSVKAKQKIILNQMVNAAQQSLLSQSSSAGLNAANYGQVQIQNQILQNQQALIDKIKQVDPSGRVVLRIKNNNAKLSDLPQSFALEDGDTIYIPPRPNTVDVIGQVYNPATFDYESSLTVSDYISQAGTENDFADTSKEYVLQANGILYSRAQSGWFGGFASRKLNPGDTVIVPQQIQFGSALQELMNWTQIIANSAQAVALFNR